MNRASSCIVASSCIDMSLKGILINICLSERPCLFLIIGPVATRSAMLLKVALLLSLIVALGATAAPHRQVRTHASKMRLEMPRKEATDPSNVTRWFKSQLLDHFDAQVTSVWSQRYFVNESFFDGKGPVFLCVGGEGPWFDPDVVITGSVHCADMILLAERIGALVLAIEHRYYGPPGSLPVPDFSTSNMRWLSSRQALADISLFHSYITQEFKLGPRNKWVAWGGSYPGMMAAFSRLKYPTLIHASVSSSAPVQAQYNFQGYNDVVAASMADADVGGSEPCHDAISAAFAALGQMLSSVSTRPAVETMFNVCTKGALADDANCASLSNTLSEIFPAQSNDPLCDAPACNIALICDDMTNASLGTPLQRLAQVTSKTFLGSCVDANATADVQGLVNTTIEGGGDRTWFYQTCTEFAFYQTCDPGSQCIFTREPHYNNIDSYQSQCMLAFAINSSVTQAAVQESNNYYGGWHPQGSRIIFVNGVIDPWRALSIQKPLPTFPALLVPGARYDHI
jgi:serine protease 16